MGRPAGQRPERHVCSHCQFICLVCFFPGLPDAEVSSTRAACEEAMTVLEEVIMFTFQQSVYYLTKVRVACRKQEAGLCEQLRAPFSRRKNTRGGLEKSDACSGKGAQIASRATRPRGPSRVCGALASCW